MNNYEKVADWIIEECDTPHREVAWLLEKLYENKKPKLTFEEAYGDVLKMLKESGGGVMDSNQRKADLLYCNDCKRLSIFEINEYQDPVYSNGKRLRECIKCGRYEVRKEK